MQQLPCQHAGAQRGRPETQTLRGFLTPSSTSARMVGRAAHRVRAAAVRARSASHILCGLAVAVSNVDEVVATIRSSADPAEARERLMTRALARRGDRALHRADRRSLPPRGRRRNLPPVRDPGPRHPRPAPPAPHRARRQGGHRRAGGAGGQDHRLPRHPALALPDHGDHLRRAARGARALRRAPPFRDRGLGRRPRRRGSDRARGDGRHRHRRRLHQAHPPDRVPRPAPRRQGHAGHDDQGRGLRHHPLRRQHPHGAPVLHHRGHGLHAQDLAPAARRAQRRGARRS
jgi:hypothetical protein